MQQVYYNRHLPEQIIKAINSVVAFEKPNWATNSAFLNYYIFNNISSSRDRTIQKILGFPSGFLKKWKLTPCETQLEILTFQSLYYAHSLFQLQHEINKCECLSIFQYKISYQLSFFFNRGQVEVGMGGLIMGSDGTVLKLEIMVLYCWRNLRILS